MDRIIGLLKDLTIEMLSISQSTMNQSLNVCMLSRIYGQAERAISIGKLNTLLCVHLRPINAVVFRGPS